VGSDQLGTGDQRNRRKMNVIRGRSGRPIPSIGSARPSITTNRRTCSASSRPMGATNNVDTRHCMSLPPRFAWALRTHGLRRHDQQHITISHNKPAIFSSAATCEAHPVSLLHLLKRKEQNNARLIVCESTLYPHGGPLRMNSPLPSRFGRRLVLGYYLLAHQSEKRVGGTKEFIRTALRAWTRSR